MGPAKGVDTRISACINARESPVWTIFTSAGYSIGWQILFYLFNKPEYKKLSTPFKK
jgi:hypothetical protein